MTSDSPMPDPANRKARSQAALVDFLRADIALAFTLLEVTETERLDDAEHSQRALSKAQDALNMIRRLMGRLEVHGAWAEIQARADELEDAIRKVEGCGT